MMISRIWLQIFTSEAGWIVALFVYFGKIERNASELYSFTILLINHQYLNLYLNCILTILKHFSNGHD